MLLKQVTQAEVDLHAGKGKYEHRLLKVNQKFALSVAIIDYPIAIPIVIFVLDAE